MKKIRISLRGKISKTYAEVRYNDTEYVLKTNEIVTNASSGEYYIILSMGKFVGIVWKQTNYAKEQAVILC